MSTQREPQKRWVFWLIMVVGGMLIFNLSRGAIGLWKAQDRLKEAEKQLQKLTNDKTALEEQLKYQLSDDYAEKEIRQKLGMAKPGEMVVILPEISPIPTTPLRQGFAGQASNDNLPDWKKWLKVLGF